MSLEVREGDHVTEGQILLQQDTEVAAARLAQATAQAAEAQHRLTELQRGARKETIAEARARVASARAAAERDEREFIRSEELVKQRLISQSPLDQARAAPHA